LEIDATTSMQTGADRMMVYLCGKDLLNNFFYVSQFCFFFFNLILMMRIPPLHKKWEGKEKGKGENAIIKTIDMEEVVQEIKKKRLKKRDRNKVIKEIKKHTYYAYFRNAPGSYRKYMILFKVLRGKNVKEALAMLKYINKKAARITEKLIKCALNDYEQKTQRSWEDSNLFIVRLEAYTGRRLKRWRPAFRGMAHPYRKNYANLRIELMTQNQILQLLGRYGDARTKIEKQKSEHAGGERPEQLNTTEGSATQGEGGQENPSSGSGFPGSNPQARNTDTGGEMHK